MYKKHTAYGTTAHTFEFDPETYWWTIEIGKSGQLETLYQIAPDADYSINWSVFDWNTGKDGYGRIQNGDKIIQPSNYDFPTVSFVDGKLRRGEFPVASPGFPTWRILVQNGRVDLYYVFIGNGNVKDARSALGQLKNGNIVFITVEGDDTKKQGMTSKELAEFCVSLGCEFACDCDGGGSTACRSKDGYIYNQGRAIASAMVVRKKTLLEMCLSKVGCGYVWGAQGEILTRDVLNRLIQLHGRQKYYFSGYSAEKWLGKQVFDCSGLIVWAANKLGIFQADYTAAGLYNLCQPVQSPEAGDLCFNADLTHVGIYAGNGRYLHAKGTKDGVVITDKYTFTKFGRLKGVKSVATDWNAKNKEFVKYVQKTIGTTVDGLAGAKTMEAFDRFAKSKGNAGDEIKAAWNKFMEAIK
jgi:hypothetical protein